MGTSWQGSIARILGGAVLGAAFSTSVNAQSAATVVDVPEIPFDSDTRFLKYSPDMNLGEVLGVAINSKGQIVVLNHPGNNNGPLYSNASTQLLEFDKRGRFVREIGKNVYGLGYAHGIRFDRFDNLWVVDKGTHSVMRFNPAGYVTMNLGRRLEGPDEPEYYRPYKAGDVPPRHVDGYFGGPTDIAFDSDDNIYVSDGYRNSRVAKYDANGNWVGSWGSRGTGGPQADQNPSQFTTLHNIAIDRQNNVYVADRNNRRIQVFDRDGKFLRFIHLNASYNKKRHPVLGDLADSRPDQTQPWTLCITNTPVQYLFTSDEEPGRIYKMTLDGRILGTLGESGRGDKQFNWIHSLACPSENELLVADMNNWRVQKITLHPERVQAPVARR